MSILQPVGKPHKKPHKEMGSLEGFFQTVGRDGRGRRLFHMEGRVYGDEIKCFVSGEAERQLARYEVDDVWRGQRISVFGTIHFRAPGRIAYVEATKIRFLRIRCELPDVVDIIDPDFTGGLKSEVYLERLRDGTVSRNPQS